MTSFKPEDILHAPHLVQQCRDDVYLLIDPHSPNWVSVNELGSAIVRHCDGRHTLKEITKECSRTLGIPAHHITSFLDQAATEGLISTAPDMTPAYRGRSHAIAPATLEELWIYTNNSCPLRCKHCLVDGGVEPVPPMTAAEIRGLVDDAVEFGAKRIYFTGGDPFMRDDLIPLVEYVTSRAQLVVLTSGVLLTEDIVDRLKGASNGNLLIQISLEGPDAPTNDAIRGSGNFVRAVQGIRLLIDAGIIPIITTTLTRINYHKAAETTRFLASLGVKDHHILWLHGRGRMKDSATDLALPGETVAGIMQEIRQAAKGSDIIVDNFESMAVRVRGKRGRKNDLCNSCYGVLSVAADGHVYPCAAMSGAGDFDCGSIRDSSLRQIALESPTTGRIRDNSVQKRVRCNSCFLKYFCGGGCFAQSYFDYEMKHGSGCLMAPDPYCDAYKSIFMELMWEAALPDAAERDEVIPRVYRAMENELSACAAGGDRVIDAAFEVGTYHCACVLAVDVTENKGEG